MIKAILFDLDDTLIDWGGHYISHWEKIEKKHLRGVYDYICQIAPGFNSTLEVFSRTYVTRTRDAWAAARSTLLAPHLGRILVETAEALGAPEGALDLYACLKAYNWGKVDGTEVFPDSVEGLTLLRDRGLKLGLVTNASQPMLLRDVEMAQHGLLDFFPECRFAAADVGYLKPHPNIFAAALDCLGVKPEETIFIGDNPVADIAGAQSVGMKAIIRVNHPAKSLISGLIVPDAAINTLHELPAILDEWHPGWQG